MYNPRYFQNDAAEAITRELQQFSPNISALSEKVPGNMPHG